eukprot:3232129-Pyramimonas_sp.AAC.1
MGPLRVFGPVGFSFSLSLSLFPLSGVQSSSFLASPWGRRIRGAAATRAGRLGLEAPAGAHHPPQTSDALSFSRLVLSRACPSTGGIFKNCQRIVRGRLFE